MDPQSNVWCPYKRRDDSEYLGTEEIRTCEDGGRDCGDVARSQEMPGATSSWEGREIF